MRLRPSVAKPRAHRARIRAGGTVQLGNRAGESSLWHVAEGARLVSVHGKLFVVKQQLAQQLNLLHLIVRRSRQPFQRLVLDAVDLALELFDLRLHLRRERDCGRGTTGPNESNGSHDEGPASDHRAGARKGEEASAHDHPLKPLPSWITNLTSKVKSRCLAL